MWVIVREQRGDYYLGMLDNRPGSIAENDSFWLGTELPFEARHIVAVAHANEASLESLNAPPPIPWR